MANGSNRIGSHSDPVLKLWTLAKPLETVFGRRRRRNRKRRKRMILLDLLYA